MLGAPVLVSSSTGASSTGAHWSFQHQCYKHVLLAPVVQLQCKHQWYGYSAISKNCETALVKVWLVENVFNVEGR